ncbi:UPF0489 protein C5orf22 [Mytilus coruscus]|uniref:UPF0489 protein C5orf22 n=1 Tax=Mytilus coruscus TaxID=42192 RepID=A0A6J8BLC2_MYTCO|nr:UPF0489 protein C5orf22 [Mytilus coruscus]
MNLIRNKTLKKFAVTPLYIVEDHNDVVPFIHRGIGSKHLPIEDIVFVHFDSHPDLLIPCDMKADDVYKKDVLYQTLSIENWIIPMVYAGHISHIIWFKPPWCEQIQDKEIQFYVGKCNTTGCIRTTCKENYFVSETLYCSEENLENKKEVKLSVITIVPNRWDHSCNDKEPSSSAKQGIKVDIDIETRISTENDTCTSNKSKNCNKKRCDNDNSVQDCKRLCTEDLKMKNENSNSLSTCDNLAISENLNKRLNILHKSFRDKHFILDIDLDFFSTQNPFRVMYSDKIYGMLKDLYRFDKPKNLSDEEISKCTMERQKQLSELKSMFYKIHQDRNAEIDHPSKDLILILKEAILNKEENPDFLLLHEAGCTCDDTELPHHVSSEGEITLLISAVQETLSHFHKPVMVTMARSSITDEYCPPDQVESIQEQTLEMLQDLYLEINVTNDYDDRDENV